MSGKPRRHLPLPACRSIFNTDALGWLAANPPRSGHSVVTSLPDLSELPGLSLDNWRAWFVGAARSIIQWLPQGQVAIFYQSDIRHQDVWIDKAHLIMTASDAEKAALIWHKIVCRKPPGTIAMGRPSYSHMLCIAKSPIPRITRPGPDILADAGPVSWSRGMGEGACRLACRFLIDETKATTVVDPFCGEGAILGIANVMGLGAIGIDLSPARCRAAATVAFQR